MPRPRSLEPAQLATAALAVLDRDGLTALTMRSVAAELGRGTMSAYRYVDGREELERLVVDHVLSPVDFDVPRRASWQKRLTIVAQRIWRAVAAHPSVVPLLLLHRHDSASIQRSGEVMLGILADAGFEGVERVIAFRTFLSYLIGALEVGHLRPLSGSGTDALAALPDRDYPNLAATARKARAVSSEHEFNAGLAIVLRGMRALLAEAR
jgi:AcrR family transcriptional regulator